MPCLPAFPTFFFPALANERRRMFQSVLDFLSSAYVEIVILALLLVLFFQTAPRTPSDGLRHPLGAHHYYRHDFCLFYLHLGQHRRAVFAQPQRLRHVPGELLLFYTFNPGPLGKALSGRPGRPGPGTQKAGYSGEVWQTGKRFYYLRYVFRSLFSGTNPFHFLSDIANDRVRDDIKDALRQSGVEKKLISL